TPACGATKSSRLALRFCIQIGSRQPRLVQDEREADRALNAIINDLRVSSKANRIAISDAPLLAELTRGIAELEVCPKHPLTRGTDFVYANGRKRVRQCKKSF